MITLDFETRSKADLKRVGSYRYALDPSTTILCLAWAYDDEDDVHLWHPAFPERELVPKRPPKRPRPPRIQPGIPEEGREALEELFDRIAMGEECEAHNAFFERCVWTHVGSRLGWPAVDPRQWRCSAAKAASYAIPRSLVDACRALRLRVQKDTDGARVMLKCSQPATPILGDANREWHDDPDDLRTVFEYCRQDVRAERALSRALRDLPPSELAVWRLDQEVNWRGVYCDRAMVEAALRLTDYGGLAYDHRMRELTGGLVGSTRKRDEFLTWLREEGLELYDVQGATLDVMVERPNLPDHVREALEVWRRANRTSTKKYKAFLDRMAPDDRVRDILRYHGASTGRWAGQGIQPQNFPRGSVEDMAQACAEVRECNRDVLELLYGDVMELLAGALRGVICAPEGRDLVVADYSAIEARGTFWIADDVEALEVFHAYDAGTGPDIYKVQAAGIYQKSAAEVTKDERQMGKQAVLGLGYQMGASKFKATVAGYGIFVALDAAEVLEGLPGYGVAYIADVRKRMRAAMPDPENAEAAALDEFRRVKAEVAPDVVTADDVVRAYRAQHPKVKQFWRDIEAAAIEATRRGRDAEPVECGRLRWAVRGRFLHCRLPSGRLLSYCDPWVDWEQTKYGPRPKLKFWGIDTYTHKWSEQTTYGGKLTENVVQALCRDLMAEAMLRVEAAGYSVVLSVHDELVSEVPVGFGSVQEFEALMAESPAWAAGMPVAAEGWRGTRYRK